MKQLVARHDTAAFLILTYAVSWPLWLASGALWRTPIRAPDLSWLIAQIGVFAPAFSGMVVGACVEPGGIRRALRLVGCLYVPAVALGAWIATRGFTSFVDVDPVFTWGMVALAVVVLSGLSTTGNRLVAWPGAPVKLVTTAAWSVSCLLAPVGLFLAAWSMTSPEGTSTLPPMPTRDLTPFGVLAAFAMNLAYGGSLGEEPGWRGAWLPRLLCRHTPVAAGLIIGFWWALWHAPIDLAQGFGVSGLGALAVRQISTLPMGIILVWVTLRAGGSLLPPLILHTTINAIPDFALGQPARYEQAFGLFWAFMIA
ncbi:MAG: type II CAAX prenyl endopeptidase Rce1 family protein, partial [Bacteroidales bacterium]